MASQARTISIDITGRNASAVAAFNSTATAAERAAAKTTLVFNQSTSKIGRAFAGLGDLGAQFGLPFTGSLNALGTKLDQTSLKAKNFGSTISAIGGAELLAAGAAVAFLGTSSVKAAGEFDTSHARLVTAVNDTGKGFHNFSANVTEADHRLAKLGFTNADTENALSRLVASTKDTAKAMSQMNLATDIARARGISLSDATDLLVKVNAGFYATLHRTLGVSNDLIKSFKEHGGAIDYLASRFGGQAAAYAETFNGKLAALHATANELQVTLGNALIPSIEGVASAAVSGVQGFQSANAATDGWLGKVTLAAAATPALIFAMSKLSAGGAAVGGALDSAVAATAAFIGVNTGAAASAEELALAEAKESAAAAKRIYNATILPGLEEKQAAAGAAYTEALLARTGALSAATAAEAELLRIQEALAAGDISDAEATQLAAAAEAERTATLTALATAEGRATIAGRAYTATSKETAAVTVASGQTAAESTGLFAGLGSALAVLVAPLLAAREVSGLFAQSMTLTGDAAKKLQDAFVGLARGSISVQTVLSQMSGAFKTSEQAIGTYPGKTRQVEVSIRALGDAIQKSNSYGGFGKGIAADIEHFFHSSSKLDQIRAPINQITKTLSDLYKTDPSSAIAGFEDLRARLIASGRSAEEVDKAFKGLEHTLGLVKGKADVTTQAQVELDVASRKLEADFLSHAGPKTLAADYLDVHNKAQGLTAAQNLLSSATNSTTGIIGDAAQAATKAAPAYDYLAKGANTATEALDALSKAAFAPIVARISIDTTQTNFDQALQNLNNPDMGASSGGGGATQTAIAAAIEHAQKELSVRDALRAVATAASGVSDAEYQLGQAQNASSQAAKDLAAAQKNYNTVLKGNAAGSKAAIDAARALTDAQAQQKSSALDLIDAQKSLADAQAALKAAPRVAAEGVAGARRGVVGARLDVADAKQALALAQQSGDSETIIRAQLALADSQQKLTDAIRAEADARKHQREVAKGTSSEAEAVKRAQLGLKDAQERATDSVKAANQAQKDLNYTLHGYPPTSKEAKDAQQQLTDAQNNATSAARAVTSAQQSLQSAQDNVATSALNLKRAQADLKGQLDSTSSGFTKAGKHIDSYITRLDAVKSAAIDAATAVKDHDLAIGHSFGFAILDEIHALERFAAASPALAHAFDVALANLETQMANYLAHQNAQHPFSPSSPGSHVGQIRAMGGPVLGDDPSGIPIMAHPGEYVVRASAVQKYGMSALEKINASELPKFATGGVVGAPVATVAAKALALGIALSTSPADARTAGGHLMGAFFAGIRKVWDEQITPFFNGMRPDLNSYLADASTWLTAPADQMMAGMWEQTQTGYAPIRRFFQRDLRNQLTAGAVGAAAGATSGWSTIEGAFSSPVNWTISSVLNPLVNDVNAIAHAVGMKDVASKIAAVPSGVGAYEKGGVIPKTGLALVHKGEGVLPKAAMTHLSSAQFDALKTGTFLSEIYKSVAAETKQKQAGTGATGLTDAVANKAATDVLKYVQALIAANPPPATFAGGGPNTGLPLPAQPKGGDPRVPGHTIAEWAFDLLKALGERETSIDLNTMVTWANHESGGYRGPQYDSGGLNNPLNTTEPWPGSTMGGAQGNIRNYPSFAAGVAAQAQNLSSPNFGYPAILAGLRASDQRATFNAIDASAFGTKGLATGGPVGPGSPKGIPILAHPGEYVIKASSVAKYGEKAMEVLNAGKLPKFDTGGLIGSVTRAPTQHITYEIHISMLDATDAEQLIEQALQNITRKQGSVQRVRTSY